MSADGMLVRSPLEAARVEIREMSAYATRLESELCEANKRALSAESYATLCMHAAQAMLLGFQMQDAATVSLLNYIQADPECLDETGRKLLAVLEATRRSGMRRAPVSRELQPAAAE